MTGGSQALQAASAMVAGVVVARVLGAEAKGQISVLAALGSIAVLLGSFGVQESGVYFLGRFKERTHEVLSNNTAIGLIGGVFTAGLLGLAGLAFHDALLTGIPLGLFAAFLLYVPFKYFNEFARRLMLATGRVALFNLPDAGAGIGLLIGTPLVIAVFGHHVMPLVLVRVLTEVLIFVVMGWGVIKALSSRRPRPNRGVLRKQVGYGLKNYASSLLWIVLIQSDIVLCNHFLGNGPTGVYSVAVSLGLPITMLGSVIGTLIFQRVSADATESSRVANTNRVVRVMIPVLAIATLALGLCAGPIVDVVYGPGFGGATNALLLLLPGLFFLAVELVLMNYLAGNGSPPMVYLGPLAGLAVNIGANLYTIPHYGINGASVTSSVGYGIVLLLVGGYYLRITGSSIRDLILLRQVDLRAAQPAIEAGGR